MTISVCYRSSYSIKIWQWILAYAVTGPMALLYACPLCPLREAGWSVVMLQLIPHSATSAGTQVSGGTFKPGKYVPEGALRGMSSATRQQTLVHLQPPSFCSSLVQCLSLAVCGESGSSTPESSVLQQNLLTWGRTIHQAHTINVFGSWTLLPAQSSPPYW